MVQSIHKILNWGIGESQSPLEQRRVRLLNIVCWLGIIANTIYIPVFLILKDYAPIGINIIGAILLFSILKLNQKQKYKIARFGLCIDLPIYFVLMALGVGEEVGLDIYFILTAILPLLFFDKWEVIIPFFLMNVLFFLFVKVTYYYIAPYFYLPLNKYVFYIRLTNFFNLFALLFIIIGSFKSELLAYQKNTEEQRKFLAENNEEIRTQNKIIEEKSHALENAYNHIKDSVAYAKRIQNALLGSPSDIEVYFAESFLMFQPKDIVSGDFYWFYRNERKEFSIIVLADCTGHGVPGAFMTVMGANFLDEIINQHHIFEPSQILHQLDYKIMTALKQIKSDVNDGMDLSLLLFDRQKRVVKFSGAKNPLWLCRNDKIEQIKGSKFPIGSQQYQSPKKFETQIMEVKVGDMFYLFSDGFQDQFGGRENKKYFKSRFREFLLSIHHLEAEKQKMALEREFFFWKNDIEQTDDVSVAGIRIT